MQIGRDYNMTLERNVTKFLFWRHAVTTPYLHCNWKELEVMQLAVEIYLVFAEYVKQINLKIVFVNSTQPKVQK